MAVTFDDLPGVGLNLENPEYLSILEGIETHLKKAGIPSIGFVNEGKLAVDGQYQAERLQALRGWAEAGFLLGNHTKSHISLNRTPAGVYITDILEGEKSIEILMAHTGQTQRYFRHPFLHTGRDELVRNAVNSFLDLRHYTVAPVTIDNGEWIYARAYDSALAKGDMDQAKRIVEDYLAYMIRKVHYFEQQSQILFDRNMDHILLLHANRLNRDHVGSLLQRISDLGYSFISLDEALQDPAYQTPDGYFGPAGITWLHRWALGQGHKEKILADEPQVSQFVLDLAGVDGE